MDRFCKNTLYGTAFDKEGIYKFKVLLTTFKNKAEESDICESKK